MSITQRRLAETELSEISVTLRNAGVAGAGGAGFPTYAKWERIESVDHLLVNHQESEPNYFIDKWLGRAHAEELAALFDVLLEQAFETVVVGAKLTDREDWLADLEAATDGAVYLPADLPVDADAESGVVFAYTDDNYQYGMEQILMQQVAGEVLRDDLPMDRGWIVQNTETMYNVYRALADGAPVTTKYLHVAGRAPTHRFLEVPVGTTAAALLSAAGVDPDQVGEDQVILDGGPGWCFEVDGGPGTFGVRKRTNCVLLAAASTVVESAVGDGRIDLRDARNWSASVEETAPTATLEPDRVRVPLVTNPAFDGVVQPSDPIVEPGDTVSRGEMIARPAGDVSVAQHASIRGEVTAVSEAHVEIRRADPAATDDETLYWTFCVECGSYVVHPDLDPEEGPGGYVCTDCQGE